MVDVSQKPQTARRARAQAVLRFPPVVYSSVRKDAGPKGGILGPARIAGIQGAKKTADLIPLCHPLGLDHVHVDFEFREPNQLVVICEASSVGRTGVEMEALTGASVAALTVYDMCKALDKEITIGEIRLLEKRGGKSGDYRAKMP